MKCERCSFEMAAEKWLCEACNHVHDTPLPVSVDEWVRRTSKTTPKGFCKLTRNQPVVVYRDGRWQSAVVLSEKLKNVRMKINGVTYVEVPRVTVRTEDEFARASLTS